MRTQVFEHKGIIGIISDYNAEGLLNAPSKAGQLGFVLDASFCDIQPKAIEALKLIPKSHDAIGDVDVFKADNGTVVFCWLGGNMAAFDPKDGISGSRTYSPHLLLPTEFETPEDFKKFVNENYS